MALIDGGGRDVEFNVVLDANHDRVLVDGVQIQQVLVNLIRNALEAMQDSSTRQLIISSEPFDEEMIQISIRDSGSGLEQHIAQRLFHPFISTKASGMGLGLSICHTIINAHEGKIWAEPSSMGGTRFNFTLISAEGQPDDD